MADYNYHAGKQRVQNILNVDNPIQNVDKIPKESNFTYANGYYGWVTAVFVDIRESSTLFQNENKVKVAKIIRSFTSEVIDILSDDNDDLVREIGIRGDCVYAIYSTPYKSHIQEILDRVFYVNTYIKMLNKLLSNKGISDRLKVGIGMSSAQELVVKAGKKGSGINNAVWIGKAVTTASNLSGLGSKNGMKSIVISGTTHSNLAQDGKLFTYAYNNADGDIYHSGAVYTGMDNWINAGMRE